MSLKGQPRWLHVHKAHLQGIGFIPLTLSLKEIYWKLGDSGSSTSCGMDGPRLRYLPSGRGREGWIFWRRWYSQDEICRSIVRNMIYIYIICIYIYIHIHIRISL